MGKSTRPVYWGRAVITGCTEVGDMLEWARRMVTLCAHMAEPAGGVNAKCTLTPSHCTDIKLQKKCNDRN